MWSFERQTFYVLVDLSHFSVIDKKKGKPIGLKQNGFGTL